LDQGDIVLSVTDQGIGVNPADLERIFTDFYRVDNTDRRRTSGAGLGLSLAREIVRLHGGRIWAESLPGKGSTFFIALPADPASAIRSAV
jgi:signal transduction histidine kinase